MIHPFESAGLGLAPFRLVGFEEKTYSAAPGHSQPAGTCDYCANGIKYCCHIQSHDGKRFVVGCDCVRRLDSSDNVLRTSVQRAIAKMNREKRDAERAARWQARRKAAEAELQRQRDANGGLTDAEVTEAARAAELAKVAETMAAENQWLISVLRQQPGDFCRSMVEKLHTSRPESLSSRCVDIMRDIYCKSAGRRNSKAYKAAEAEFDSRVP